MSGQNQDQKKKQDPTGQRGQSCPGSRDQRQAPENKKRQPSGEDRK